MGKVKQTICNEEFLLCPTCAVWKPEEDMTRFETEYGFKYYECQCCANKWAVEHNGEVK